MGTGYGFDVQRLSRANFEFSLDAYRELSQISAQDANLIFSPFSITFILAMLWLGSGPDSKTDRQLMKALHYTNLTHSQVHMSFRSVMNNFRDKYYKDSIQLANGLFIEQDLDLLPVYQKAVQEFYHGKIEEVDFKENPEGAKDIINDWVNNRTNGEIRDILKRNPSPETLLILTNVVSMRAKWQNKFDKRNTFQKGTFNIGKDKQIEIPMMSGQFVLPHGHIQELNCRILELPFTEKRMSLFILLPSDKEQDGISRLEANLTDKTMKMIFSTLKEEQINVRLPRFKIEQETDLETILRNLGLTDIFTTAADFSSIAEKPVHVSALNHRSVLKVHEEGADAAAVTITAVERIGSLNAKYFEVDRSFIFIIWDYWSGTILFFGRIVNPEPIVDDYIKDNKRR